MKNIDLLAKLVLLAFLFLQSPHNLLAQFDEIFFEEIGEIPKLGENYYNRTVQKDDGSFESVIDTSFESFDGIAINQKGVIIGYRIEGTGAIQPKYNPGVLFRSTDHGKSWKNISKNFSIVIPNPKNNFEELENYYAQTIYSLTAMDTMFYMIQGLMAGSNSRLLRSDDNGETWSIVSENTIDPKFSLYSNKTCAKLESDQLITYHFNHNWTFSGGTILQNISEDGGNTWKNVTRTNVQNLLPTENLYWRAQSESIWLEKEEWIRQNPNFQNSGLVIYSTPVYKYYEDQFHNTIYRVVAPEAKMMETILSKHPEKPSIELIKSTDNGKTWKSASTNAESISQIMFVDCSGNIYATLNQPQLGLYKSSDDGKSWQLLVKTPNGYSFDLGPEGHLFVVANLKVYRSQNATCCGTTPVEPKPEITYGTTIITHDRLFHSPIVQAYPTWMQRMAEAILKKAKKGNIYVYLPETGNYQKIKSLGSDPEKGEQILIFDWARESIEKKPGFTGSAAQALYLSLTKMNTDPKKIPIDNIHFIGHGRGCIVNSLAIEKLYLDESLAITIDQVTNLGPYENKYDSYYDNEHPEMLRELYPLELPPLPKEDGSLPKMERPYCGIIKWDDHDNFFDFSDTYWQNNGKHYAYPIVKFVVLGFVEQYLKKFRSKHEEKGTYFTALNNQLKMHLSDYEKARDPVKQKNAFNEVISKLNEIIDLFDKEDLKQMAKQLGWFVKILNAKELYDEIANSSFDSNPVRGTYNIDWSTYQNKTVYHNSSENLIAEYFGICDAYIESIKNSEYGKCSFDAKGNQGGYCFARLNGGEGLRTYYKGFEVQKVDSYEDLRLVIPDKEPMNRIRSVYNGSFDRGEGIIRDIPGWSGHGGEEEFFLPESSLSYFLKALAGEEGDCIAVNQGEVQMVIYPGSSVPTRLRQNRFFVPSDANSLSFEWKTRNVKKGSFQVNIIVHDQNGNRELGIEDFDILADEGQNYFEIKEHGEALLDISSYQNQVISIEFLFKNATDILNHELPKLIIDNVRLTRSSQRNQANSSISRDIGKSVEKEAAFEESKEKKVNKPDLVELENSFRTALTRINTPNLPIEKRLSFIEEYQPLLAKNSVTQLIGEKSKEVINIQSTIKYLQEVAFSQVKRNIELLSVELDEQGRVTVLRVLEQ